MYEAPTVNPFLVILWLIVAIILVAANWKLFTKAGKPGWAVLIPIYNVVVYLQIVDKPVWWIVLFFIPIVNIVIAIIVLIAFVQKFGQPAWHVVLALFLGVIYFPYLAFSSAEYKA